LVFLLAYSMLIATVVAIVLVHRYSPLEADPTRRLEAAETSEETELPETRHTNA
jgi:hypothetical protein